jgi:4-hydroxythreonine-4-phosphate dehydrogenase
LTFASRARGQVGSERQIHSTNLPLALTLGEPAGIGPDLTLDIWRRRQTLDLPPFYIVGNHDFLASRARTLGFEIPLRTVTPAQASAAFPHTLPIVPLELPVTARPGKADETSGPAAIASIRRAVNDVMAGQAAAIVTNPISKNVLYRAGFIDPGHTEFLSRLVREKTGQAVMPVMMLWSPELAVVPVTIHIPLKDVVSHLTTDLIANTGRIVARDMVQRFGLPSPRLAISGLNPHAGEGGTLGTEDETIVAPAVAQLRAEGITVTGPLSADTMFRAQARARYDVALCMYHDQALIPIKTLAFDRGVNVTLGLPFVRTSPDHGTAFDLAGTGRANSESLVAAVKLAAGLSTHVSTR